MSPRGVALPLDGIDQSREGTAISVDSVFADVAPFMRTRSRFATSAPAHISGAVMGATRVGRSIRSAGQVSLGVARAETPMMDSILGM
jgi:hypothetical protein